MKKTFCALLSLLLVAALGLTGCGNTDQAPGNQETSGETTAAVEEKIDAKPTSLGKLEGNVYTNTYAGFGCKLDDSWIVASADELQEMPDEINEMLDGTQLGEAASKIPQIMDMQAQSAATGSSVNVLYTQLSKAERMAYKTMNEEEIVDALLENKDIIIDSYTQNGITVKSMEKATAEFLGEEHTVCKTVGSINGVDVYIVQVLNHKLPGEYGLTITFSAFTEAEIESMMSCFYKVD